MAGKSGSLLEIESGSSSLKPAFGRRRRNTLSFRVFDVVNDFVVGNYRAIKSAEDRLLLVNARVGSQSFAN
jgi:hypothetical protein